MKNTVRFAIVYLLFGLVAVYLYLHTDVSVPINKPFEEFPRTQAGWQMTGKSEFSAAVLGVLKVADYLSRQYADADGNKVSLYLGYHSGGKGSGGIHSPKHCLPGSGWLELSTRQGELQMGGVHLNVVRAVYQKGGQKELYLYWYQVKGQTLSSDYLLKLAEIKNSLLYSRRDSAFIRISVPFESDEQVASARAEKFARDFYPAIQAFLPQ